MRIPAFLWLKRYFDTGVGLTSYFKYVVALFGLYSLDKGIPMEWTLLLGVFYIILCFSAGYFWIKYKMTDYEYEISNLLNPFQKEVREKLK
jgi:hypothetical protein